MLCPRCKSQNKCQLTTQNSYKGLCWCFDINISQKLIQKISKLYPDQDCLCKNCLLELIETGAIN